MDVFDGTGEIVEEPNWGKLLKDRKELYAAKEYWRVITTELRERTLLSPSNRHAIQRLVMAYVVFDRSSLIVAEEGAVLPPAPDNPKAISRISPHVNVMRDAATDATNLEAELGLSPRRRAGAAKVAKKDKVTRASDKFFQPKLVV